MDPHLIKLSKNDKNSFSLNLYQHKRFPGIWHYHPEFEITYIQKSEGTRFVGDHIETFHQGELVMIGENLPHTWKNDAISHVEKKNNSEALVLHFLGNCFGDAFWDLPETEAIKKLLHKARLGLKFDHSTKTKVIPLMLRMLGEKRCARVTTFLTMLDILAHAKNLKVLSSVGFIDTLDIDESERINKAYQYIMNNFKSQVSLKDVARVSNMSESAFSRFFSNRTRKSFSQFLIELRIGYACKLLMKADQNVTQVCFESGFNNISNFNKQFKSLTRTTPKKFQQAFVVK